MIDRQSIINAIDDIRDAISDGLDFNAALNEIASEYKIPAATIVVNIERVEPIERFEASCISARKTRQVTEEIFSPLRTRLLEIYRNLPEPPGAQLATIIFIQKTFDRQLWTSANAYARRQISTIRLTRKFSEETSHAPNP